MIAMSFPIAQPDRPSHGQTKTEHEGDPSVLVGQAIRNLNSDSFAARQLAQQRLLDHAKLGDSQFQRVRETVSAVRANRDDLELFLTRQRLLDQLDQFANEIVVDRFLYDDAFDASKLTGWTEFSRHAGKDRVARSIYVQILQRNPAFGRSLVGKANDSGVTSPGNITAARKRSCPLESIEREDSLAWMMLLAKESSLQSAYSEDISLRLVASLRYFGSGPMPAREAEQTVIGRLIDSYLEECPADLRDRIVIATRFRCLERTRLLCRTVLGNPSESPSRIVTALLAANAIGMSEVDRWIDRYRTDYRTSHVWRSINTPKTTHRTQVCDVAFALRLHRKGIDPRQRGFAALEADPIMVFRAYSLGFETQEKRKESHAGW